MSSSPTDAAGSVHPALQFARRLCARLDELSDVPVWSMSAEEHREFLATMAANDAKAGALRLRALAEADRSGATDGKGAGTAADWVAVKTRTTRSAARADLRLGRRLEKYAVLGAACDTGAVNLAQARVVVNALDRLPTTGVYALGADQITEAEIHLVEQAAHFDADKLKLLGQRVFEVVAPELAEQWEGRKLEAQEAKALRKVEVRTWEDRDGIRHGRFRLAHLHGQMFDKMLAAFMNPGHPDNRATDETAAAIDPDLPLEVRRGLAFTALIEAMNAADLPRTGGCGATVVVTMRLEQLLADLDTAGVCTLDTGGRISAAEARRLACVAGIIPVVLGGASQVLDAGRKQRLHSEGMRVAMGVRDGGCSSEGCTAPPGYCHAHHDVPWSQGGRTSVDSGRLLCPHHHRRLHDPRTRTERLPDGKVRFHRRT